MPGKVYTGIQMTIPNSDKMLIPARGDVGACVKTVHVNPV